ncbi:hypothetical protein BKE38_12505 [Pseudoroseomonas deserti]|uniref:HTH cro/C1-type domain-containing protein n=1 Tax=Teichococcus deserti TaxID=1817963 RepID=A0A1V2H222_9PROT|nr:hypothetical protein BKE38_12505 [Pseudoroseomonas deserti]
MTLSEFQKARGLTLVALATLLGHPVSTVHSWLSLKRRPTWTAVADIERKTEGAVTAADFVPRAAPELEEAT